MGFIEHIITRKFIDKFDEMDESLYRSMQFHHMNESEPVYQGDINGDGYQDRFTTTSPILEKGARDVNGTFEFGTSTGAFTLTTPLTFKGQQGRFSLGDLVLPVNSTPEEIASNCRIKDFDLEVRVPTNAETILNEPFPSAVGVLVSAWYSCGENSSTITDIDNLISFEQD